MPPGQDEQKCMERYKTALEQIWDYLAPFGFAIVLPDLNEPMYNMSIKVTADLLMDKESAIVRTPEQVAEKLMRIKEFCSYGDFFFNAWFEGVGYSTEETEENMTLFAEECMPELRRLCSSAPTLPNSDVQLGP